MRLRCTRDSVAAGDDVHAPHEVYVELADGPRVADLIEWFDRSGPPASVAGGSTWALQLSGRVVALLSRVGDQPQRLATVGDLTAALTDADELHLLYLLADDLDRLAELARADPTRADLRRLARYSRKR